MPPKTTKAKPKLKCIKFGEILIDENKKVLLLCVNCLIDFMNFQEFCNHLKKCTAVEHLFNTSRKEKKLDCETGNLIANLSQTNRDLVVYGINSNKTTDTDSDCCIINIEEEILNPRWYTDPPKTTSIIENNKDTAKYNNLIEEVTPFVQFKENVRTLSTPKELKNPQKQQAITESKNKQISLPISGKDIKSIGKQDILNLTANIIKTKPTLINNRPISIKRKASSLESLTSQKSATSTIVTQPPVKCKRTEQVVNNLQKGTQRSLQAAPMSFTKINTNINNAATRIPQQTQRAPQQTCLNAQKNLTTSQVKNNANCNNKSNSGLPQIQKNSSIQVLPNSSTIVNAADPAPTKDKTTVDILNKLQTLGLKIQRTNSAPTTVSTLNKKNDAALEIIKKLQSKGMEVKRVPKSNITNINSLPENSAITPTVTIPTSSSSCTAVRRSTTSINNNMLLAKSKLQKNVLIRKLT